MRQYDVIPNPSPKSSTRRPYLVVLQHDFVASTETVLVAPLARDRDIALLPRLFASVSVHDEPHLLLASEIAPIARHLLRGAVANAEADRDAITAALDFVFFGI